MYCQFICRHTEVEWIDSHQCRCIDCGKHGHWFEEGYAIWIRSTVRPQDFVQNRTERIAEARRATNRAS